MRVMPEGEANEEAWHLLARTLDLLRPRARAGRAGAPRPAGARVPGEAPGRQRPAADARPLRALRRAAAAAGLLGGRRAAPCATRAPPGADPVGPRALEALAALVGRPLAEAREALPHEAAPGVERLIGLVLQEHLGVRLRSAAPL